jgi:hypothetical protein
VADKRAPLAIDITEIGRTETANLLIVCNHNSPAATVVTDDSASATPGRVHPSALSSSRSNSGEVGRRFRSVSNFDPSKLHTLTTGQASVHVSGVGAINSAAGSGSSGSNNNNLSTRRVSGTTLSSAIASLSESSGGGTGAGAAPSHATSIAKGSLRGRVSFAVPLELDWSTLWKDNFPCHFTFSLCYSKATTVSEPDAVISDMYVCVLYGLCVCFSWLVVFIGGFGGIGFIVRLVVNRASGAINAALHNTLTRPRFIVGRQEVPAFHPAFRRNRRLASGKTLVARASARC